MVELYVYRLRIHRILENVEYMVLLSHVVVGCDLILVDQKNLIVVLDVESQPL